MWLEFECALERFQGVSRAFEPKLRLGHTGDCAEVIGIAGEDALAVLDALGEPALKEIDDSPLVVCFCEVRSAQDQPGHQNLGLVELIPADRQSHLAEHLIVLGRISTEPDRPQRVFSHAAHHGIVIVQCST